MLDSKDINEYIEGLGSAARSASNVLSSADTETKNLAIKSMADAIENRTKAILDANKLDLEEASKKEISDALLDRLELTEKRIKSMISSLLRVVELPDPIGEVTELPTTPSGIKVSQMRVPLGVVGIIYESRPDVTADAAALCLKSGNACILRGGSESFRSNNEIAKCLNVGLIESNLPESSINLVGNVDRRAVSLLLSLDNYIDVIIPRGGKSLVGLISSEAKVPVIKHLDGICHVFIDKRAELQKALDIAINAKTYSYSICGAMETLLVHKEVAKVFLPKIGNAFKEKNVELRGCEETLNYIDAKKASEEDWVTEYLGPILSVKVVDSMQLAIEHINLCGSSHTDSIVTEDIERARLFINKVDSSSVMHNVPTCWADGFEYGLGAEVGISTDKFHARGPVGLKGLTCQKYIVEGNAELRGSN